MPGIAGAAGVTQGDISGIPLSAIERIEILPSTAGGIYGGGATGGVVNIILKRDYDTMTMTARYDDTFDGGGAERRLDATAGLTLGRTGITMTASYRDGNPLYAGDRDFAVRARQLALRNNPAAFGASTSPPVGYTPNIRSQTVSGVTPSLVFKDGLRPLGSTFTYVPANYSGIAGDGGLALMQNAGRYNIELANGVKGTEETIVMVPSVRSLTFSARHEFSDRISAYLDGSHLDNRAVRNDNYAGTGSSFTLAADNPNNPFTTPVVVNMPLPGYDAARQTTRSDTLSERLGGGLIIRLPADWSAQAEYTWGSTEFNSGYSGSALTPAFAAAVANGTINPLRDPNVYRIDFSPYYPTLEASAPVAYEQPAEQKVASLRISGPLFRLPGGALRLASLLERRKEYTGDRLQIIYAGGTQLFAYSPPTGSADASQYVELTAPLFSSANARPGIQGLEMMASYRHDQSKVRTTPFGQGALVPSADGPFPDLPYETREVSGNQFTLGVRYSPVENIALRLSYGRAILPPDPFQLGEYSAQTQLDSFKAQTAPTLRDPARGNTVLDVSQLAFYSTFGSLMLRPEQSRSWSGGFIITPSFMPGVRLSVDYTRIRKVDEIGSIGAAALLNQESLFPGYVVRAPLSSGDAALGYTGGLITELHTGNVNIANALTESWDFQADYTWDTRYGSFSANLIGTLQTSLLRQTTATSPVLNSVGYRNGPLKWRVNPGLRWTRGNVDLGWDMQYYDAYRIFDVTTLPAGRATSVALQGSEWIPSQDYHDVYGRYRFEGGGSGMFRSLLENTELQLAVKNVLNAKPPVIAITSGSAISGYAPEGNSRLRRYSISFQKQF